MGLIINGTKYCCNRLRVYTYLKSKGFKEVGVKPDRNNPRYCVWFFNRSEELRNALNEYFQTDMY